MSDELKKRPLSPHISIYRAQYSSIMSILHRVCIIFNFVAFVIFFALLFKLSFMPKCDWACKCTFWQAVIKDGTYIFINLLTLSIIFNILVGIRHLYWETGRGYGVKAFESSANFIIALTVSLTAVIWLYNYKIF